jgi:hypothetical protein
MNLINLKNTRKQMNKQLKIIKMKNENKIYLAIFVLHVVGLITLCFI